MQWVETTGRSVEEAKVLALDQLGVDVDDGRLQFGVLEDEHSRHAAQPGLREGDWLARLHLLRAARDDPQPWGVTPADTAIKQIGIRRDLREDRVELLVEDFEPRDFGGVERGVVHDL